MIILPKRIYTEQQERAINARGGSVLVSAAAGSGKTSVLTERVIRLITDKENPDKEQTDFSLLHLQRHLRQK